MRNKIPASILTALTLFTGLTSTALAKNEPAAAPLSERGQELEAEYAETFAALKAELSNLVPAVDPARKAAYLEARAAEKAAKASLDAAKNAFGAIGRAQGLVGHAKGKWIGGAERAIAAAQSKLDAAQTDAEREAAKAELASAKEGLQAGQDALKERQALLDEAKADEPRLTRERDAAQTAYDQSVTRTINAITALELSSVLSSDAHDAKLAKYVLMLEATPRGLAVYAQAGRTEQRLVKKLLGDSELMLQMVVADGAKGGQYGKAMEIYTAIQKASRKAKDGVFQRLALAISLEHAVPLGQRSPVSDTDAAESIDPVNRYLHYEAAFLAGELDPGFPSHTVWDYRMVVDGNEPDDTLAWGREMLRSYRPDHITTDDYRWRYVALVRTCVRYGSQYNKYDDPEQQFFQNILMNGGVCGRRAFIGRFMLRSFGVPTTARPQPGHAALAHWTPDGWVICLGGGWGVGHTKGRYNKDRDFLANTQAREARADYLQVKRAQWIGDVVGEKQVFGFFSGDPDFWYGVSLYTQRAIIEDAKAVTLAAVGEELGEANESDVKYAINAATVSDADRQVSVNRKGVITIPAAATSNPTESTGKIIFMPSNLGGLQLHYSRTGDAQDFEYTFEAPQAGTYALIARVASPGRLQQLSVAANGAEETIDIDLPVTAGLWKTTEPVELALAKGKNVLTFSRSHDNLRGLTIRDFTLTPAAY